MNLKSSQYAAKFVKSMFSGCYCYITKYPTTPFGFSQKLAGQISKTVSVG